MADEGQIDGTTHYGKDSNGDIVHDPDKGKVDGTTHYEKDGSGNVIHSPDQLSGGVTPSAISNLAGTNLTVDGNGDLNASTVTQIATGTVTATGGSTPALNTTLQNVSTNQLLDYVFTVYVESDPSFNADYAFNFDYSHSWDDANSELDIDLVVNWDTDPGSSNDLSLRWEVLQP